MKSPHSKVSALSRRGVRAVLFTLGVGAVASLSLFAAAPDKTPKPAPRSEPAQMMTREAQHPAAAPMAHDGPSFAADVDWSRVETVEDPGPRAIAAYE